MTGTGPPCDHRLHRRPVGDFRELDSVSRHIPDDPSTLLPPWPLGWPRAPPGPPTRAVRVGIQAPPLGEIRSLSCNQFQAVAERRLQRFVIGDTLAFAAAGFRSG
jgi:hypothetical protein